MSSAEQYTDELEDLIRRASEAGYAFWAEAEVEIDGNCCRADANVVSVPLTFTDDNGDFASVDEALYQTGKY